MPRLKKSKNPRKTRKWVGGSSPNLDFFWGGNFMFLCVFCVVYTFPKIREKLGSGWVGQAPTWIFFGGEIVCFFVFFVLFIRFQMFPKKI